MADIFKTGLWLLQWAGGIIIVAGVIGLMFARKKTIKNLDAKSIG